jgi:hypothetical protein
VKLGDNEALYRAKDFGTFWSAYERAHAHPKVRYAHAAATTAAAALVAAAIVRRRPALALLAPAVDYVIAQASHRLVAGEKTVPWRRPAWHLRAELRLCRRTIRDLLEGGRGRSRSAAA